MNIARSMRLRKIRYLRSSPEIRRNLRTRKRSVARIAAWERREVLDWLKSNPRWWDFDGSYLCDIYRFIAAGVLSADEMISLSEFRYPDRMPENLRHCIESNLESRGGRWDGSLVIRARLLKR